MWATLGITKLRLRHPSWIAKLAVTKCPSHHRALCIPRSARGLQLSSRHFSGRENMAATFRVGAFGYTVRGDVGALPTTYNSMVEHATLHDDFDINGAGGTALVISVESAASGWPELVVSQRFEPGPEAGFFPGALLVPENHLLFIGAGTRLLAYDLRSVRRVWEDAAETGFWEWKRHDDVVLMSAELEFAAWDLRGKKMWTAYVEPPWDYAVRNGRVELDIMDRKSSFHIKTGPVTRERE